MTNEELDAFLELLRAKSWSIELTGNGGGNLNESFTRRYPRIPEDYAKFLRRVASCANADDTVWFLCADHYNGTSGLAFDWNEFETMDLESAEGDDLALGEIREFWDHYLPFIMSVSGDYAYLALCVSGDDYGSVVDGYASDFEGVTKVAASFDEFLGLYGATLKGNNPDLNSFV